MYTRAFLIFAILCSFLLIGSAFTLNEECDLPGDYSPCGDVTLGEVVDFISLWVQGQASLSDVVALISAWASPEVPEEPPEFECTTLMSGDTRSLMEEFFSNHSDSVEKSDLMALLNQLEEDSIENAKGPNAHKVFYSTSTDGFNFSSETAIINSTSVPDAILMPDGTIRIYGISGNSYRIMKLLLEDIDYPLSYADFDIAMCPMWVPVELAAFHSSNGIDFFPDVLRITNLSLAFAYADPSIVLLDDGSLRLYFMGANKSLEWSSEDPASAPIHHIFSATSTDGVNFNMEPGYRLTGSDLTDPDVLKIENQYKMYWNGGKLAVSDDGMEFTEDPDGLGFYVFCLDVNDWHSEGYRMYYNGDETFPYEGGNVTPSDYITSFSSDGINWIRDPGMRLGGSGCGSLIEFNPTSFILYTLH